MSNFVIFLLILLLPTTTKIFIKIINGQPVGAQVKITAQPFPVANSQHLNQIIWTMLGRSARETIYCVSETPVSQLRFVCVDCVQKNVTDIVNLLNSAQDLTLTAGFPTVTLANVEANPNWNGVTIMCQAALNGGTIDSSPATVDVRYMRQLHIVDNNSQGPVVIANQGNHFYVECNRGPDGQCQASRRKTLHCAVQAHPPANTFRWLKNGGVISGNGPEITIGTEMIGQSIQCSANNGLFGDDMPTSQAVFIDPYSSARLIKDNFHELQSSTPFTNGNRLEINQHVTLNCIVEGNPRPVVFWKLRKTNGQVVDAPCPQGLNGQYREVPSTSLQQYQSNLIRLTATCDLQITNYTFSGQYWCSACSYVSQGYPECSPGLENPGDRVLNIQVQGPPMQAESEPTVEQYEGRNNAAVYVHFCAEPMPRLPRDVIFSIDGNDIQTGQDWQNFHFDGVVQNNTVQNCFFAKLKISPIQEDDQQRQIFLKVSNTLGSKHISVSLGDLLGVESSDLGGLPMWIVVLFAIIAFSLFLVCSTVFYLKRHSLCGERIKDTQTEYSNDKLKPNGHGYSSDDAVHGGLFGANGNNSSDEYAGSNSKFDDAYHSAYGAAFTDSRMSSV